MGIKSIMYYKHFDKVLHAGVGVGIGLIGTLFFGPFGGLLLSALAGIGKEVLDAKDPEHHTVDKWDALWTMFGGAAGTALGILALRLC